MSHHRRAAQVEAIRPLKVYRSVQCALFAGVGLFSMGVLHGKGKKLHEQCSDDVFIQAIILYFLWYFVSDLTIIIALKHWRTDLLVHHGVALTGIVSLVLNNLYPCSSAPVAVTELISLFSGVEAMLPKPEARSKGEESVFYVIRSYRLAVLVFIRPFLWSHVRNSAEGASSHLTAAVYLIPGGCPCSTFSGPTKYQCSGRACTRRERKTKQPGKSPLLTKQVRRTCRPFPASQETMERGGDSGRRATGRQADKRHTGIQRICFFFSSPPPPFFFSRCLSEET